MKQTVQKTISSEESGIRLDKYLGQEISIQTRNRAVALIEKGIVYINSKTVKASYILKAGDVLEYSIPQKADASTLVPLNMSIEILYEDEDLVVVNKPSGVVVHPAAGHEQDTLVNILIDKVKNLSMGFGEQRPGIVHRIDKETSGILVVAKNDFSHEHLSMQFKKKTIRRVYEAVVVGHLKNKSGTLKSYLARHPVHRKKIASVLDKNRKVIREIVTGQTQGKWSVTHYKVLEEIDGLSLLELRLETGRTHQIRVHLSEFGYPVLGDKLYGAEKKNKVLSKAIQEEVGQLNRFLLHAKELEFNHPKTGERMQFKSCWPLKKIGQIILK